MINVLDHGYVKFIEGWGHGEGGRRAIISRVAVTETINETWYENDLEAGIVEAARQSTQGAFRGWDQDRRLLAYLFNSRPPHAGPFEFAGMIIEVQAPIFVFREWHRHRTQSYAEMSARYAPLPDVHYVPSVERLMHISSDNKQAAAVPGAPPLTRHDAEVFQRGLRDQYREREEFYQHWLSAGVPKELARLAVPMGRYSRMRASANLRNWLAFLTLRLDPAAQWEIRQYAHAVGELLLQHFPETWRLFVGATWEK